jgi:hypothetical protein
VDRRADDARLSDIQDSVHQIRSDVRGLERRYERSEERISDVERSVIENAAAQKALEQVMNAENQRLTDRIQSVNENVSRVGKSLEDHTSMQRNDFKVAMRLLLSVLFSVLGAILYVYFEHYIRNGG